MRLYQQVLDMGGAAVETLEKVLGCTLAEALSIVHPADHAATNAAYAQVLGGPTCSGSRTGTAAVAAVPARPGALRG
jgi:hypothetical protein